MGTEVVDWDYGFWIGDWGLGVGLELGIEILDWGFGLVIWIENCVWGLNSNWEIGFGIYIWGSGLIIGIGVWN